jgi:hypothetical protein
MHKLSKKDLKINYISDTVVSMEYFNETATAVILKNGDKITADYFVSCIGQESFNQRVFKEEYISYSDKLLTTKALFYPVEYSEKSAQFHPYTVAKTMKYGWRWITPTLSRIGTGYVFSDNHVSVDEAVNEFVNDVGLPNISPHMIDFYPRRVKDVFKTNTATIGMASGFLEPLDAPGLAFTLRNLDFLEKLLTNLSVKSNSYLKNIDEYNVECKIDFDFFCSFILHQYKTASRNDSQFWKDHKAVKFDFYDSIIDAVFNPNISPAGTVTHPAYVREPWMFYNSTAGKDIAWPVKISNPLIDITLKEFDGRLLYDHREFFDYIQAMLQSNKNI